MGQSIQQNKVGLVRCTAQAKNGDELFWEEKFHAANGKAQACTQGALHFSLLSWQGVGGGFFSVFPGSHYVPFKFPSDSQHVPQVLMFSIAPHLQPICFGKCCTPSHI
jgi:hypothetical protein